MRVFVGEFVCVGTCVCACLPTMRSFAEGSLSCLAAGAKTLITHIKVYDQRGSDLRVGRKRAARGGVCVRTISAIHIQE